MNKLKRLTCLILAVFLILPVFSGCSSFGGDTVTLRIMNWADYMDYSLLRQFENEYTYHGKKIKILYETIDKPESMAVKIEKGKESWDLMCPSESVLERLMKQNLLKKINTQNMDNYNTYVSEYIKNQSDAVEDSAKAAIKKIETSDPEAFAETFADFDYKADYSVAYMWGNFGILYNVDKLKVDMKLLDSWEALWNTDKFKGQMMMKNGPRESFAIGIVYVYREPLMALYKNYEKSGDEEDLKLYKEFLSEIFKISGDAGISYTINQKTYQVYRGNDLIVKVEEALVDQKKNALTVYETDDGKDEMVRGAFAMDMAWNGDAIWAMAEAEKNYNEKNDNNVFLNYIIPKEGSNFWVDSWVIPKYAKNQELAEMFVDFLCSPESSMKNMEYIGYTSAIGGQDVLNWAVLNGGNFDNPIDASYFFCQNKKGPDGKYLPIAKFYLTDENNRPIYKNSLGYDKFTILAYIDDDGYLYNRENDERIINTTAFSPFEVDPEHAFINSIQYPDADDNDRCGIMLGYSDYNDEILKMWSRVKGARIPLYILIILSILVAGGIAFGILVFIKSRKYNKKIKMATIKKPPAKNPR